MRPSVSWDHDSVSDSKLDINEKLSVVNGNIVKCSGKVSSILPTFSVYHLPFTFTLSQCNSLTFTMLDTKQQATSEVVITM